MEHPKKRSFDLKSLYSVEAGSEQERRFHAEFHRSRRRERAAFLTALLLLIAAFILSFGVGRYALTPGHVLHSIWSGVRHAAWSVTNWLCTQLRAGLSWAEPEWMSGREDTVVWLVRMPRILAAILVGGALSVSGATYQGLFRNPMVSPDILGASAGASVGACLMMLLNQSTAMVQIGAFIMGIVAVALSYSLSKAIGRGGNMILLLVLCGMTVNTLFSAIVSIIKYMADTESQLPEMTYWLMGSIAKADYKDLLFFVITALIATIPILSLRWRLNVLSFGEDEARALGVNVAAIRLVCIVCATLLTAAVVSIAGTIGWVGLMIPHLVRFIVGPNNKTLLPLSMLTGAVFMLIIDDFCRSLLAYEIPLGVLTSLLGAPFFIFILYKRKGAA